MAPEVQIAKEDTYGVDAFGVRRKIVAGTPIPAYVDTSGKQKEGVQPSDRAAAGQTDAAEAASARRSEADDEGRGPGHPASAKPRGRGKAEAKADADDGDSE